MKENLNKENTKKKSKNHFQVFTKLEAAGKSWIF